MTMNNVNFIMEGQDFKIRLSRINLQCDLTIFLRRSFMMMAAVLEMLKSPQLSDSVMSLKAMPPISWPAERCSLKLLGSNTVGVDEEIGLTFDLFTVSLRHLVSPQPCVELRGFQAFAEHWNNNTLIIINYTCRTVGRGWGFRHAE